MPYTPKDFHPTLRILRTALEEALSPYLGNYENGAIALWVEPPSSPKGLVTGGLECVVARYRTVTSSQIMLNDQVEDNYEWLIVIKTRDRDNETYLKFDNAITAMRSRFPRRRETISTFTETGKLTATFRIGEVGIYRTNRFSQL